MRPNRARSKAPSPIPRRPHQEWAGINPHNKNNRLVACMFRRCSLGRGAGRKRV
jgi:hypothetical protein